MDLWTLWFGFLTIILGCECTRRVVGVVEVWSIDWAQTVIRLQVHGTMEALIMDS